MEGIIYFGGEGVILRKQGSFYERGRTASLLKLKVIFLPFLLKSGKVLIYT
jgi:ATP-dependent DNA ligase